MASCKTVTESACWISRLMASADAAWPISRSSTRSWSSWERRASRRSPSARANSFVWRASASRLGSPAPAASRMRGDSLAPCRQRLKTMPGGSARRHATQTVPAGWVVRAAAATARVRSAKSQSGREIAAIVSDDGDCCGRHGLAMSRAAAVAASGRPKATPPTESPWPVTSRRHAMMPSWCETSCERDRQDVSAARGWRTIALANCCRRSALAKLGQSSPSGERPPRLAS